MKASKTTLLTNWHEFKMTITLCLHIFCNFKILQIESGRTPAPPLPILALINHISLGGPCACTVPRPAGSRSAISLCDNWLLAALTCGQWQNILSDATLCMFIGERGRLLERRELAVLGALLEREKDCLQSVTLWSKVGIQSFCL